MKFFLLMVAIALAVSLTAKADTLTDNIGLKDGVITGQLARVVFTLLVEEEPAPVPDAVQRTGFVACVNRNGYFQCETLRSMAYMAGQPAKDLYSVLPARSTTNTGDGALVRGGRMRCLATSTAFSCILPK